VKPRRAFGLAAVGVVSAALVVGCSSGGGSGFNEQTQGDKSQSSVRFGSRAKIPADFPTAAVPLPDGGKLQAVITGKNAKNRFYTLTYGVGGGNGGVAAGRAYSERLAHAGYDIKNFQRLSGTDGGLTTFEAVGRQWDLSVVSGKSSPGQSMSIQIATHGTLTDIDELNGIDNGPSTDNPDGGSSTTSTSDPLAG
jgi:hypothetical protein